MAPLVSVSCSDITNCRAFATADMFKPNTQPQAKSERFLQRPPEVSFFIACLVMVNQLRALDRTYQAGDLPRKVFADKARTLLEQLSKTVAVTEQFDIVLPVLGPGQFSPSFWRWFNWWEDYFHGLTQTQIGQIERLGRELSLAVNRYRPKNHWLSCPSTPPFVLQDEAIDSGKA